MIKLKRGKCPEELDDSVKEELTKLYKEDNTKAVWNSPKIKEPLKTALINMSKGKCAYCECKLNVESKDITIDHFLPKVENDELVVEWTNLLPSCLRCNRQKNANEERIINPCQDEPKEHLAIRQNGYRLSGKSDMGKNSIRILGLNDIDRVMVPRMTIVETILEHLNDVLEDISELEKITPKYINRTERFLSEALSDKPYSASASAKILDDTVYKSIKDILLSKNLWNNRLIKIENELKNISLDVIK